MGCVAALLGGLAGTSVGIALTFALLAGENADAFTWLAAFTVFAVVGGLLGIGAALVWRVVRNRRRDVANPL